MPALAVELSAGWSTTALGSALLVFGGPWGLGLGLAAWLDRADFTRGVLLTLGLVAGAAMIGPVHALYPDSTGASLLWVFASGQCQECGVQDVLGAWSPGVGPQLVKDREERVHDDFGAPAMATSEGVEANGGDEVCRVEDDHVIPPILRDAGEDVVNERAFRFDDDEAASGPDVRQGQVGEQR